MKIPQAEIRSIITIIIVILSFLLMFVLVHFKVPSENKDLVNVAMGFILSGFAGVIGYYFGSSKSSEAPAGTITQQTTTETKIDPPQ